MLGKGSPSKVRIIPLILAAMLDDAAVLTRERDVQLLRSRCTMAGSF
jgi:hypothetical protein